MKEHIELMESLTMESLTPEEKAVVEAHMNQLLASDSTGVLHYAADTQRKIATAADQLQESIKAIQTPEISRNLAELSRYMNVLGFGKTGFFDKILSPKVRLSRLKRKMEHYRGSINQTIHEVDKNRIQLMKNLAAFQYLYEDNQQFLHEISLYIIAVEELIFQFQNNKKEIAGMLIFNKIEHRLHDLKLTHTVAMQMSAQIKLIQENEQLLAEKIQSSLLNMIPLWQMQLTQQVTLAQQQAAKQIDKTAYSEDNNLWEMGQQIAHAVAIIIDLSLDNQKMEKALLESQ